MPSSLLFVSFVFCRRAIRTAFKNRKRAAILTTHYMEEAEAVCDRVAVLVSGRLRWAWPVGGGGAGGGGLVSETSLMRISVSAEKCFLV